MAGLWDLFDKIKKGVGQATHAVDDAIIPGRQTLSGAVRGDLGRVSQAIPRTGNTLGQAIRSNPTANAAANKLVLSKPGRNIATPILTGAAQPILGLNSLINPQAGKIALDQRNAVTQNSQINFNKNIPLIGGQNPFLLGAEFAADPTNYIPVGKGLSLAKRVGAHAALGAAGGLTNPAENNGDRFRNIATGAVLGGAVPLAGAGAKSLKNSRLATETDGFIRFGKPVENLTEDLYHGAKGAVTKQKKTFKRVLEVPTDQKGLLQKMASEGDDQAASIVGDKDFFVKADQYLRQRFGQQFDAIRYNNDQLPNKGVEFHELANNTFWAKDKATASIYSRMNRGGKYEAPATPQLHPDWNSAKGQRAARTLRELEANMRNIDQIGKPKASAPAFADDPLLANTTTTKPQRVGEIIQARTSKDMPWEPKTNNNPNLTTADIDTGIKSAMVGEANKAVRSNAEIQAIAKDIRNTRGIPVKAKVNMIDYLRTPDRVLKKLGMEKQAGMLKKAELAVQKELPDNLAKVTAWSKEAKIPGSEERIFRYLDGNKGEQLYPSEQKIAREIQTWLGEWAERLELPKHRRVSDYITHIFEKELDGQEFDDEFARLIQDKIPGSVYNPFTQQRLGKKGYIEDVWRALDAYTKRATRKFHMDPALHETQQAAALLDLNSEKFIKRYIDRVNYRPTELDGLIDTSIKSIPGIGYKFGARPTATITRGIRTAIYRGTLGGNVMSPLKNLTQGINTYAELGEKYTTLGYAKMVKGLVSGDDELFRVGALANDQLDARTLSATKQFTQKMDKALFAMFDLAEKINRGAAYYGKKSQALAKGATEEEAIEQALETVRKTQFVFGNVNTPVAMQSDIVKLFTQFQSYNLKQTEYITEMLKNKEGRKILRFIGATLAVTAGAGKFLGMKPTDFVPVIGLITGDSKVGSTPFFEAVGGAANVAFAGDDEQQRKSGLNDLTNAGVAFIPGGVQAKKTITGLSDYSQGESTTSNGRNKFDIAQNPQNLATSAVFGSNRTPEGTDYRYRNESKGSIVPTASAATAGSTASELKQQLREIDKERDAIDKAGAPGFLRQGMTDVDKARRLEELDTQEEGIKHQQSILSYEDKISTLNNRRTTGLATYRTSQQKTNLGKDIYRALLDGELDEAEAGRLINRLGGDIEKIETATIISLPDTEQAQYVNEAVTSGVDPLKLIQDKVLTYSVAKRMLEAGLINGAEYDTIRGAIKGLTPSTSSSGKKSRKAAKPKAIQLPKTDLAALLKPSTTRPAIAKPTITAPPRFRATV